MSNSIPTLGVIMGYYGPIWSDTDIKAYADFCADTGISTFIYGPKQDAHLRDSWQTPWSDSRFEQLQKIREAFKSKNIAFGMAFSPENISSFGNTTQADLKARITGQLNTLELDILSVGFDDISPTIVKSLGTKLAPLQVEIAHYIKEFSNASQFYAVPSYYSYSPIIISALGPMPKNYLQDFGKLNQEFGIFWTGSDVISQGYSPTDLKAVGNLLARKVTLWDNYPVNDPAWLTQSIANIYALTGRSYHLADEVDGHFVNPMIQPHLSQIPLQTLPQIYNLQDKYIAQDEFITAVNNTTNNDSALSQFLIEEIMSFRELSHRPDYALALKRLQQGISAIQTDSPIKSEITNWLEYVKGKESQTLTIKGTDAVNVTDLNNGATVPSVQLKAGQYAVTLDSTVTFRGNALPGNQVVLFSTDPINSGKDSKWYFTISTETGITISTQEGCTVYVLLLDQLDTADNEGEATITFNSL